MPPIDRPIQPCTLTWYDPALGGTNSSNGQKDPHAKTASGEPYDAAAFTCAAPSSYAFGTIITFYHGSTSATCKVNDRGGAIQGSHFDLSRAPAQSLGVIGPGIISANFQVRAPGTPVSTGGSATPGSTGGTAGAGGTGTLPNDFLTSGFRVGDPTNPDEDYWTAINRISQERYWYPLAGGTPVPTPSGWTTMENIQTGGFVFGTNGNPARVLDVLPIQTNRECFKIEFRDGSSLVADGTHQWCTTKGVLSTADMEPSVVQSHKNGRIRYQYRIDLASPLELPETDLPIDPYILGYWLGDGSKTLPRLHVGNIDRDSLLYQLNLAGLQITNDQHEETASRLHLTTGKRGEFCNHLRALGVYDNKHIPAVYLRSSYRQRFALLQGLMDSDGWAGYSKCTFANTNMRLARDAQELLRTLGFKTRFYVREGGSSIKMPQGHTSVAKDIAGVKFPSNPAVCPFRIPRKATAYYDGLNKLRRPQYKNHHVIIAITPVPSVPVRCITVDTPDHLFLVGESMVPTHNCFSDGETLYLADGPDLMRQPVALSVDRVADAGNIRSLSCTFDNTAFTYASTHKKRKRPQRRTALAKVTSPVEAQLEYICAIDEVRAGDVVELSNCGPGNGKWLVGDCRRSVFDVVSEINLVVALTPFSEGQLNPAGVNANNVLGQYGPGQGTGNLKGYFNPVGTWTPGRIDQGVDGTLQGNYVAPGDSDSIKIFGHGWPGGTYIAGRLTSGSLKGKWWYVAEGVTPMVTSGATVKGGTPIARPSTGLNGTSPNGLIETGWADPNNPGATLAQGLGSHDDQSAISIACGNSFNRFITKLGARPGAVHGRGVGVAPANLPSNYP